jgi:uncharacterized membrane protein
MRRQAWGGEVSSQTLSTGGYGVLLRRSLARGLAVSLAIVGIVFALAAGPALVRDPAGFARAFSSARPMHAPDLTPILRASPAIQIHLATIAAALIVTGVLLSGLKGTRLHRTLGWAWSVIMLATAVSTLFIRATPFGPHVGPFGILHIFALLTFVSVPRAVLAARRHDVARHAAVISGFVVGGLGLAGIAAFLPGRLLWAVWFG